MKGRRRPVEARDVHQRAQARLLAVLQRDQALLHEGAVQPGERHHVGDGAERDEIEQLQEIGLGQRAAPEAAAAQLAIEGGGGHEGEPRGAKLVEPGKVVGALRIDDGIGKRQIAGYLMMVDDDDVEVELRRFRQRLEARRAAIDGDQEPRAALGDLAHGVDIGPVALEQPIGDVEERIEPGGAQHAHEERGRGGAVDVVIAEDRDPLLALDGVGEARGGAVHVGERRGIGHQAADARIEKILDRVERNAAAGDDARENLRQAVALADGERRLALARPAAVAPDAPGHRARDAQKGALGRIGCGQCTHGGFGQLKRLCDTE